jgi:hypothetical protein
MMAMTPSNSIMVNPVEAICGNNLFGATNGTGFLND